MSVSSIRVSTMDIKLFNGSDDRPLIAEIVRRMRCFGILQIYIRIA